MSNSQRSHYTRRDLELLFGISSSSAVRLLQMLATTPIGGAHLVARDTLSDFLEEVATSTDVPALCERIRAERENLSRVKARYLCVRDEAEVALASLPGSIRVEPGRLTLEFESIEDLCAQLVQLAKVMQDDPVGFQARCEPARAAVRSAEAEDARYFLREIERMKAISRVA